MIPINEGGGLEFLLFFSSGTHTSFGAGASVFLISPFIGNESPSVHIMLL